MANICTNLFYALSEKVETIDAIRIFIEEHFPHDWYDQDDDFQIEGELYSRWDFPQSLFESLSESLRHDKSLYMRCLSHELSNEYACLSVYRDGEWAVRNIIYQTQHDNERNRAIHTHHSRVS